MCIRDSFLTGSPEAPRCRFTVSLVDILNQIGVQYSYVNILEDDEVCEGLKEFSSWPTYPQVYIDGELIGGYDIITVSYTHLRAHETPEHLVCRLLLEKKKRHNTIIDNITIDYKYYS
eukprot:TRINITY_DN51198_c0_g1_i1.p1 TRINITY_DN51198_c0_g1~~TRINITY_DN51198_c0_g1_i1.p1  ORF type:complete len:118 (+),score=40.69 TRINITY_DN51198_c0_g1_i1:170-523(+)